MSDLPRGVKRFKQGESSKAEAEIFSRPEILMYQNKALASYLKTEKSENSDLKEAIAKSESASSDIISWATLLFQQLLYLNDKLVTFAETKSLEFDAGSNLRNIDKIMGSFEAFNSANIDNLTSDKEELRNNIETAGLTLAANFTSIFGAISEGASQGDSKSEISKLSAELNKANSISQKLQNSQVEHENNINLLKNQVDEFKKKSEDDKQRLKVLKLRADRYFPYVRFESRNFHVDVPEHDWVCHTCDKNVSYECLTKSVQNQPDMQVDPQTNDKTNAVNTIAESVNEPDSQVKGLKKVNEALFAVISDLKSQDIAQEQDVINSRCFNRLLRNGNQMLQAYDELLSSNQALRDQIADNEKSKQKIFEDLENTHELRIKDFYSKLQGMETQLKITEIEKENLQKQLNHVSTISMTELQKANEHMKEQLRTLEDESKKTKDALQRVTKEKSTMSVSINSIRSELDGVQEKLAKGTPGDQNNVIESQSKQIKSLIEEATNFNNQLQESYSEMETIFEANQDLEAQVKLSDSKVEDANKRVQKSMEETFKRSRINENCKKEVMQIENDLKIKDEIISKMVEEKKALNELAQVEKKISITLKERESIKNETIKQLELEYAESKKKYGELKQKMEQSDEIISKVYQEYPDKLFKMSCNFVKTGKIQDPSFDGLDSKDFKNLDSTEYLNLQIKKYKQMVVCPNWNERERCVRLRCEHTFWRECIEESISNRSRKCPKCRDKISQGDLIDFSLS